MRAIFSPIWNIWIVVFVIRGCLSEANAKIESFSITGNSNSTIGKNDEDVTLLPKLKAIPMKKTVHRLIKVYKSTSLSTLPTSTALPATPKFANDIFSCSGKTDGYYINYESDCKSYIFCAAGLPTTYICQGKNERFDGMKCSEEFLCPVHKKDIINPCENLKNGYYANIDFPQNYFYCFEQYKVIDLKCSETGTIFNGDKCIYSGEKVRFDKGQSTVEYDVDDSTCTGKSSGFFPKVGSKCIDYYFCINEEMTELSCKHGQLYNPNSQVCVPPSRYFCPETSNIYDNSVHNYD